MGPGRPSSSQLQGGRTETWGVLQLAGFRPWRLWEWVSNYVDLIQVAARDSDVCVHMRARACTYACGKLMPGCSVNTQAQILIPFYAKRDVS